MVSINGSLPSGIDLDAFTDWMVRLRTKCPCVIFDSSREAFSAGLKAAPWLVKPNLKELEIWAGRPLDSLDKIIAAAGELRALGISHVVISLGAQGALWVNSVSTLVAKPPHCEIVSTVGAGDAMVAGLMYGLLMGEGIEHTLRLATAVSALAVTQSNVGFTNREQLAQMMAKVEIMSL